MTHENPGIEKQEPCLQLRGALVPMTLLELVFFEPEQFKRELLARINQAPGFFENIPLIISLERFASAEIPDFDLLVTLCLEYGIYPVAIRGGSPELQAEALKVGLPCVPAGKERAAPVKAPSVAVAPDESPQAAGEPQSGTASSPADAPEITANSASSEDAPVEAGAGAAPAPTTRVVTTPIRSGQQIYSAGDLIVMAQVSAGAEILADGNIHVYGPLRGRALAGVKGNTQARIFCQILEAELVSIAGQYKISEDLQGDRWRKNAQICLRDDRLDIRPLVD